MSDDLISRKALLGKMFPYGMPDNGNYGINARAVRDAVVGAKAVELVFCEKCKYSRRTGRAGYLFCNNPLGIGRGVVSTDFCSEGERRNDG